MRFSHETLVVRHGRRTEFPIIVALHSTILGPAVGGCRVRHYDDFQAAIEDALMLAEAMTYKAAVVDNGTGGGKSVACVPVDWSGFQSPDARTALFLDIAEIVDGFGGSYHVAPDVGSTADDMAVIARRTPHVAGLPLLFGGAGGTSHGTAIGLFAALKLAASKLFVSHDLAGLTVAVQGLGGVGSALLALLAHAKASVVATDLDQSKREMVEKSGARWVDAEAIAGQSCDILAPCALGGVLDGPTVAGLNCKLIVGAANNQLAHPEIEQAILARGITYVPDFVANAGGLAYSSGIEIDRLSAAASAKRVEDRIRGVLERAFEMQELGISLTKAAYRIAEDRLRAGGFTGPPAAFG